MLRSPRNRANWAASSHRVFHDRGWSASTRRAPGATESEGHLTANSAPSPSPRAARHTDDTNGVEALSPGLVESARPTLGTQSLQPIHLARSAANAVSVSGHAINRKPKFPARAAAGGTSAHHSGNHAPRCAAEPSANGASAPSLPCHDPQLLSHPGATFSERRTP